MKRVTLAVLFCLICVGSVSGQQPAVGAEPKMQIALGYVYQGAQSFSGNGYSGLHGGRGEFTATLTGPLSVVSEFVGTYTGSMNSSPMSLTLFTYMGGPRYTMRLRNPGESRGTSLFVQALAGGVHASNGIFPGNNTSADAFAFAAGVGVETVINRRFSVRLFQAEYLYTRLPNFSNNYQNNFRIGAGMTLRLR